MKISANIKVEMNEEKKKLRMALDTRSNLHVIKFEIMILDKEGLNSERKKRTMNETNATLA
jgi:hypothetical protein